MTCIKYLPLFLIFAISCSSPEYSTLEQVAGEKYHFNSPITCIEDAGDSLLIGTLSGKIISFDLIDGGVGEVFDTDVTDRTMYQIINLGRDGFLYSLQDAGLVRVFSDKSTRNYLIDGKESNYSAYTTAFDKVSGRVYSATSNGVYFWDESDSIGHRVDTILVKDPRDGVSNRFYTLELIGKDSLRCAGENGVMEFYLTSSQGKIFSTDPAAADHSSYTLFQDNKDNCIDFLIEGDYTYFLSQSSIYIHDRATKTHERTVELPEKRHSRIKNRSCRSFSLVKDNYLYVAPGGYTLYKMPLLKFWSSSEEVTQLCHGKDGKVFFMTSENDLFHMDPATGEYEYIRSFEPNVDVYLLAEDSDNELIVLKNDNYYSLNGRRKQDESPIDGFNSQKVGKILWNIYQNDTIWQGQVDKIRVYVKKGEWLFSNVFEQSGELLLKDRTDYYPRQAELSLNTLSVSTLHDGFYQLTEGLFQKDEYLSKQSIKNFTVSDDKLFVLADPAVIVGSQDNYHTYDVDLQSDLDKYFTNIISNSPTCFYAYAVDNIWCKGLYRFDMNNGSLDVLMPTTTVNAALGLNDKIVVGGNMGISFVTSEGEIVSNIPIERPSTFKRTLMNWHYPYGLSLFIFLSVLISIFALFTVRLYIRHLARRKKEKFEMQHEQAMNRLSLDLHSWINQNYNSKYVRVLAETLIKSSTSPEEFNADVQMFKSSSSCLDILEDLSFEIALREEQCAVGRKTTDKSQKEFQYDFGREECGRIKDLIARFYEVYDKSHDSREFTRFTSRKDAGRVFLMLPVAKKTFFMQTVVDAQGRIKQEFINLMQGGQSNIINGKLSLLELIGLAGLAHLHEEK